MPLSSVDAFQLTRIEVVDCGTAVTFAGTVGGVVSAGGGFGAGGGVGLEPEGGGGLPPSPPPQADRARHSDTRVALAIFGCMQDLGVVIYRRNVPPNCGMRRQTRRNARRRLGVTHRDFPEVVCRRTPRCYAFRCRSISAGRRC